MRADVYSVLLRDKQGRRWDAALVIASITTSLVFVDTHLLLLMNS